MSRTNIIILAINITLAITLFVTIYTIPKVYKININKISDSFLLSLEKSDLSARDRKNLLDKFAKTLEKEISTTVNGRDIFLMNDVVISGGVDLTNSVYSKIRKVLDEEL